MSYSRPCGVSVTECAASDCRCVSVDGDGPIGPENGSREFDCRSCGHLRRWHGVSGGRCHQRDRESIRCGCREFVDNPLQTAHNQSREDC